MRCSLSANSLSSEQCLQRSHAIQPWFALSCQAFQIEVVDCHDGYTILGLPCREGTTGTQADVPQIEPAKQPNQPDLPGACYILWEYAHA